MMTTEKHIKNITIKVAGGLIGWCLKKFHLRAWASNWQVIYVQKQWFDDSATLNHELCHTKQIRDDGVLWMPLKYLWYCLRFGYQHNPYELQARKAEHRLFINKGNLKP